jgi:cob(I)alamin adenosyltransferase
MYSNLKEFGSLHDAVLHPARRLIRQKERDLTKLSEQTETLSTSTLNQIDTPSLDGP